ncbi:glycoside hydrolase family 88 protein [Amycolatopsis sp. FDAARGOS 1241]|uniref:glycoside hydrolase family 88 protein n=1 Tax=Amycolatopsis sp. FDAARGOS 1241 TaxID=2778070 RepID=UPI001950091F|nr:glycoside hydrolase family 88 protein [Amycolatopsis sp. FDAARGOS 1241]QRP44667.1 glycoside hydrolase family 88 protein [Amycolatopsis sp. FDAARGOS 1241]
MSVSRRTLLTTAAGAAVAATATSTIPAAASDQGVSGQTAVFRSAADYAVKKLRAVAPGVTAFPTGTKFEKWAFSQNGDWVGGFWPGTLWMAHLYTGDSQFSDLALASADKLAPRQNDTSTHDLGFLFYPSWVTAWRLTGDDKWRAGALQAAASLIKRYNAKGHFIRAWGALTDPKDAGRIIMDTIMNLDLLDFATRQTGERQYLDIAVEHAKTAQRVFVRPDGSTPHVFDFDPATGAELGPGTVQGYSASSCWSRGQSWGIYGFTTMYRRTGDRSFLTTARRLSDFALGALTPDNVPVWDYLAPQAPNDIKDASAGVVMACGLLDLAEVSGQPHYRVAGLRLLEATARTCLTTRSTRADAVVARCTRNRPAEDGVEISLPYADYYLLEGILRVLKPRELDRAIDLSSC